ncbi:RNA ligase partner protein [Candidatus Roizmanbacteria bacterium]|nr:RNA ligase partner protein [Candidatus Roizmanbacteria bacterium]
MAKVLIIFGIIYTSMNTYVLDTNLFFNMEAGFDMGEKTESVIVNLTRIIKSLQGRQQDVFLMPPKIVDELLSFFDDENQSFLKEFLAHITVKSPDLYAMQIPAILLAQYIDESRTRNYRGQTICEEEMLNVGRQMVGIESLDKKGFEMKVGPVVRHFRDRYRQATRFGFVDSVADLELILLAKEQEAFLISTDEGVLKWGKILGVKEMSAAVFGKKIRDETAV